MLNTININLKTDIKTDRPTALPIKLMSQDKNNNQFILRFTNGGESVTLDDTYTVEVLTKFTKSGTSRLTSAKVRQDYATWEFDTAYIAQDETVYNYVYVRKSGILVVSADANSFVFNVGLSEIDKGAGKVAETYDENYEKVLLDYSGALDERTTERLDEAVGGFNQRGDAVLGTVEANELDRVTKESARQTKETERLSAETLRLSEEADRVSSESTRKTNETTRVSNENARKSAEVIRLASEVDRVNAENVRSEFYEGFDGEIANLKTEVAKKANRKQEDWITPTLLNGWTHVTGQELRYMKDSIGFVHVKGTVTGGSNSNVFAFPMGYRSTSSKSFSGVVNAEPGRIQVNSGYNVYVYGGGITYLDCIYFRAEV